VATGAWRHALFKVRAIGFGNELQDEWDGGAAMKGMSRCVMPFIASFIPFIL
jgi:hypothetical protein